MTTEASVREDIELISKIDIITSILDVICRSTGMGFSAVARVTDSKWIACSVKDDIAFGLKPGGELVLESTICNEIRQSQKPVIINWVEKDEDFANHHTPLQYGFQSYISFPIFLKDGSFFGTLCAIDPKPAELNNAKIIGMFNCFVDLISMHIDQQRELANTQFNYTQEKETAQLRESFIAILGHDLRTPVTAIKAASQLLIDNNSENKNVANLIQRSVKRIDGLIENMLDLARGRLAGGIKTVIENNDSLGSHLSQVIDELAIAWPEKNIHLSMNLDKPVSVDNARISQLFSNLLSNALKYGAPKQPIEVVINTENNELFISVSNNGKQIPEEVGKTLFRPFSRGANSNGRDGLGLGLYIAQEIARAHNGKVTIDSSEKQTSAIFVMPV